MSDSKSEKSAKADIAQAALTLHGLESLGPPFFKIRGFARCRKTTTLARARGRTRRVRCAPPTAGD